MKTRKTTRTCKKMKILTKAEEYKISMLSKIDSKEGVEAFNKLVEHNLGLVIKITQTYMNRGLDFDDILQEGCLGLIRGLQKFDPKKGYKISTYVTWWIKQNILRALSNKSRIIRIPVHIIEKKKAIDKFICKYTQVHNELPSVEKIADNVDLSEKQIECYQRSLLHVESLSSLLFRDNEGSEIVNNISTEDSTYKQVCNNDLVLQTEELLSVLTPNESSFLRQRYGFDGEKPIPLKALSERLNMSQEGVRQMEKRLLKKIHTSITESNYELQDFLELLN